MDKIEEFVDERAHSDEIDHPFRRKPPHATTPAAVLLGVDGKDWESVVLENSPGF